MSTDNGSPVPTFGLTHIALSVKDPGVSADFYEQVIGALRIYEDADVVQIQTPGSRDVIVFERNPDNAGKRGGITHFGFRLKSEDQIADACRAIEAAGGEIRDKGEFVPGEPYVFFADPDGYVVEIWYELPTPLDPR